MHSSTSQGEASELIDSEARKKYQAARLGLARRLHETLAQDLAAIGYQLDSVIAEDAISDSIRADLRHIRIKVMEAAQNFRDEIYKLRKTDRIASQAELKELLAGIKIEIDFGYPLLIDPAEELLLEAIMEIARNTMKHSNAKHFYLKSTLDENSLVLEIGDDGIGKLSLSSEKFGLRSIDESLREITSNYSCNSDDKGTHYRVVIQKELFVR